MFFVWAAWVFLLPVITALLIKTVFDSAQNMNDSMLPDSSSSAMSSAPASEQDAKWAVYVANAGMTEIELSKIAQTKPVNPRLKSFA
ncbi:hypothetical protein [Parafilimonas sp.]|uniref:hypothetical protein n=1 Tax=Parafilimonas sp. TaxID=1969739 RepID=UPI0039E620F0